jgi:Tfp pilus assembly protein PilO
MTRRQELLVFGAVGLLLLVVGFLLLIRPKQQAAAEASADRRGAAAESQSLRDQITALEALKAKQDVLRQEVRQARAEFPDTPALPGLLDALRDTADQAGVDLSSIAPAPPKASTIVPGLAEIGVSVSVAGGYFEIQDYLSRLEDLVRGTDPDRVPPRSLLVRSVSLASGGGASGTGGSTGTAPASGAASPSQLQAGITLVTFQLPQATGGSGAAATQVR